ncbi:CDP-paratose 2-epimerase [Candidatus Kaiserbacteria bacterium RIFCSPHIGHO2_02_FULL_50_50]|uniref:CDP-paratose 2-epimerase n=1 Tax=Candidatus Kaiserbacteria bacterium RIFCSPHIGHO2_02_FULL_50_50 TaxID=1798492 RepID=A0A1F6DCF2_9BACT|nr:MAG: CDP-paratose 2-epimerase [Candidatus Kaiserbacteria bacterium RIFCSPHIGHO2_02_FULL_50_50]OGG88298.1 MAG: CDP-paratose 2-epimerase [Candidatus Kaiserbacteria bacterium RIFCSPLOWO2_12_FULL_50_10]
MRKKYLITGGCGFLGSNLAAEVLRRGDELVVFDSLFRVGSESNLGWLRTLGSFNFVHGDIRNANDVEKLIRTEKPDVIFHLAGQVTMTLSLTDPRRDFETNALGTFNLLEAVRVHSPTTSILYSSTNKVYGDLDSLQYIENEMRYITPDLPKGMTEEISLAFASPYGCSKGSADQYMLDYHKMFGLKTAVFRHSSMYGGRQFSTYDQGWVGWFVEQAVLASMGKGNIFTISGNGKQVRDVLHADDMVRLYFAASDKMSEIAGQAFNIGGGADQSLSLLELFALLEEKLSTKLTYEKLPPRASDQKVFIADLTKAYKRIGWKPQVSASEGIDRMIEWVREKNNI